MTSAFPALRMRRLRRTKTTRRMVRETTLTPADFIYPFFVTEGVGVRQPISSMPGVAQLSIDQLCDDAQAVVDAGVPAVLLFGIPDVKDERGSGAADPEAAVQRATQALKSKYPNLIVITDLCLCEYTSHGHCGVIENGDVDNDATLEILAETAVAQAEA